jgi:hypothetical protein
MNYVTLYERFLMNSKELPIETLVGHGSLISDERFRVPPNTYIIFSTKAGYFGTKEISLDLKMRQLFNSNQKVRKLLNGSLNHSELPKLVTEVQWNPYDYMYGPGELCPDYSMECFDTKDRDYDRLCGFKKLGPGQTLGFKGAKFYLGGGFTEWYKGGVLFVFGCRAEPRHNAAARMAQKVLGITPVGPFNPFRPNTYRNFVVNPYNKYNVQARSNFTNMLREQERDKKRHLTHKRSRSENNSPRKARRTNNRMNIN